MSSAVRSSSMIVKQASNLQSLRTYFLAAYQSTAPNFPYESELKPSSFGAYPHQYYTEFVKPKIDSLGVRPKQNPEKQERMNWSNLLCWLINTPDEAHHFIFKRIRNRRILIAEDDHPFQIYKPPRFSYWNLPIEGYVNVHYDCGQKGAQMGDRYFVNRKNKDLVSPEELEKSQGIKYYTLGFLVRGPKGELKHSRMFVCYAEDEGDSSKIVVSDINEAELQCIKECLIYCLSMGHKKIFLYIEREDIFKALALNVGLNHSKYQRLLSDIRRLVTRFQDCQFMEICSDQNDCAHFLAANALLVHFGRLTKDSVESELKDKHLVNDMGGRCEFYFG